MYRCEGWGQITDSAPTAVEYRCFPFAIRIEYREAGGRLANRGQANDGDYLAGIFREAPGVEISAGRHGSASGVESGLIRTTAGRTLTRFL